MEFATLVFLLLLSMALPNIVGMMFLSGTITKMIDEYKDELQT
jgi:Na+/alanine symporter